MSTTQTRPAEPAPTLTDEDRRDIQLAMQRLSGDVNVVAELVRSRREAREQCVKAADAAGKVEALLADLLTESPLLARLESLRHGGPLPRAVVRLGGQLRELPIHPGVPSAELQGLLPWDYVCIHPKELVVIGTWSDPVLRARSLGEVAEFRGYRDRDQGLVFVARQGRDEEVMTLASPLRQQELTPGNRLVVQRDREGVVIDSVPSERVECPYEVPLDRVSTRLDDLAGLEPVLEPMLEDLLMRLVHPHIRQQFDLEPLKGMILYSYKPGMGKTALMRAVSCWLRDLGRQAGFDVVLYSIKPNEFKSKWHGEDARLVREFAGNLRARLTRPRDRRLLLLVLFDEVDSLGTRSGTQAQWVSPAHNDAVQALLAEMDGLVQLSSSNGPPADLLWVGLTNRPDMLDPALKRPGRFGDLVLSMPDYTAEAAEQILWVYARNQALCWYLDGEVRQGVAEEEVRRRLLRPALARVYPGPVLRYTTEGQRKVDVTAGEVLAGVHFMNAMSRAKRKAAARKLRGLGVPAIGFDDVLEGLYEEGRSVAAQLAADRPMLAQTLRVQVPVARAELIGEDSSRQHRYLRAVV